mgnify:CR=1 FL=1
MHGASAHHQKKSSCAGVHVVFVHVSCVYARHLKACLLALSRHLKACLLALQQGSVCTRHLKACLLALSASEGPCRAKKRPRSLKAAPASSASDPTPAPGAGEGQVERQTSEWSWGYLDVYPGLSLVCYHHRTLAQPALAVINTVWHKLVTNTWTTSKQESNNICEL